ncbi:MAG: hypothetical protein ACIAXF_09805 [Phycisphaerales bacterium JB063]
MHAPTPLLACLLTAALGLPLAACSADDSQSISRDADDPQPEPEAPDLLPITRPDGDTDLAALPSDPFQLGEVAIEDGVLLVTVSYSGGAADHDFTLYWNGITARSFPGQVHFQLKHDAHGDMAEAYLTQTLRFDLGDLIKPLIIHLHGHGEDDRATVQYGEVE